MGAARYLWQSAISPLIQGAKAVATGAQIHITLGSVITTAIIFSFYGLAWFVTGRLAKRVENITLSAIQAAREGATYADQCIKITNVVTVRVLKMATRFDTLEARIVTLEKEKGT